MATNRTFSNMLNDKAGPKKIMAEDDMDPVPRGGLKLPKGKVSTYKKMMMSDPGLKDEGKKEKK